MKEHIYQQDELILKANNIEVPKLFFIKSGEVKLFLEIGDK